MTLSREVMYGVSGDDGNTVFVFARNRKEAREMGEYELNHGAYGTPPRPVKVTRIEKHTTPSDRA